MPMTDEIARDIAAALWSIGSQLEDIGEVLKSLLERIEEITPETSQGQRFLRTLDISRD